MGKFSPSPKFLKYAAAVVMQRMEDEAYLDRAISEGIASRVKNAIFIDGDGPMIDLVAVRKLKEANYQ